MSGIRLVAVGGSLGFALALLFHFARAFRPVVLPTLRQVGEEPTTYFVLRIAGFSLFGWQILVFEGIVLLAAVGLIWFAVYALTSGRSIA
jgi:hypothetical protein